MVDRVVIRQHIEQGHRIRAYALQGLTPASGWVELGQGSCIGNRRIHPLSAVELLAIRLQVTAQAGTPLLDEFSAFRIKT